VVEDDPSIPVPPDALCKRLGCKAVYKDSETYNTPCVHHPGVPIFHEGVSQWVAGEVLLQVHQLTQLDEQVPRDTHAANVKCSSLTSF